MEKEILNVEIAIARHSETTEPMRLRCYRKYVHD